VNRLKGAVDDGDITPPRSWLTSRVERLREPCQFIRFPPGDRRDTRPPSGGESGGGNGHPGGQYGYPNAWVRKPHQGVWRSIPRRPMLSLARGPQAAAKGRTTLMTAWYGTYAAAESRDGVGAADHDVPYVFGQLPSAAAPFPFSMREFARLLVLRGRVRDEAPATASDQHAGGQVSA